jgi:hypothetical protein
VASTVFIALCLVAVTVFIHAIGLTITYKIFACLTSRGSDFSRITLQIISITWLLIVIHAVEISVWALFYWGQDCLPDLESAFYFSSVTYTTIGYGDLLLPLQWRMLGAVEGLAGILMCGLSTAYFFAVVSHMYKSRSKNDQD